MATYRKLLRYAGVIVVVEAGMKLSVIHNANNFGLALREVVLFLKGSHVKCRSVPIVVNRRGLCFAVRRGRTVEQA